MSQYWIHPLSTHPYTCTHSDPDCGLQRNNNQPKCQAWICYQSEHIVFNKHNIRFVYARGCVCLIWSMCGCVFLSVCHVSAFSWGICVMRAFPISARQMPTSCWFSGCFFCMLAAVLAVWACLINRAALIKCSHWILTSTSHSLLQLNG